MKKNLLILFLWLISNSALAISLGDLTKELEKAGEQLKNEIEGTQKSDNTKKENQNNEATSQNDQNKKQNKSRGEFINLPNSKYLTLNEFLEKFNNKTLELDFLQDNVEGTDTVMKINVSKTVNINNYEENPLDINFYYLDDSKKWAKAPAKIYYFDDALLCDEVMKMNCVDGGIVFYVNLFDYQLTFTNLEKKSIGNTVTSQGGYHLVHVYQVQQGDISYKEGKMSFRSNDRDKPLYRILKVSDDDSLIAKLESDLGQQEEKKSAALDQPVDKSKGGYRDFFFDMNLDQIGATVLKVCPESKFSDTDVFGGKTEHWTAEKCVNFAGEKKNIEFHFSKENGKVEKMEIGVDNIMKGMTMATYFSKDKSGIAQYDQVVSQFLKSDKYSLVRFPTKIEIDLFNKEDAFAAIDGKVRLNTIFKNNQTGNLVNYTAWKNSLDGLNFFTYFDLQYFSSEGSKKFMSESQKGQVGSDDI
jgi:hypothetical protein